VIDATEIPEGTVTVVFTDVVGSTALTGRVGDEAARSLMREVEALVREQLGRHRGTEVKGTGDGQMLAFTSARRAVLCALDIQGALRGRPSGPALRIGLHTGEVVREDADLFGAAVNAAARISALAEAGQVLLSESTRSLLGPTSGLELVDRGEHPLKGFDSPWRVFEARRASEEQAASPGTVPLVAREAERALLREALARAREGAGSVVLLSGEPGIGKTRLATELMAEANAGGVAAALGRCYEMEGTPPFVAFAEAFDDLFRAIPADRLRACLGEQAAEIARIVPRLRAQFDDLGRPAELPPEQARHYLFGCTADVLARLAAERPLLLVLDDLHWADDSTCLLLEHLARRLTSMPLLVAGTYRDVDLDASRPFAATLDRLSRETLARRVPVRRFDRAAVDGLLGALSGKAAPAALVDAVFTETEGVPFFVLEVYRYLADAGRLFDASGDWRPAITLGEVEVPEGVRLVISRRLERISAETQGALALAAVIGRGFSFDLLRALTDLPEDAVLDALEEAEHAHLIAETGSREAAYSFAHEQIRQTLLGTLSLPRRQRYHLRVADAIEATTGSGEEASAIAHHLYQAGAVADPERTARWLGLAGEKALAAAAFEDALRYLESALSLQPADDAKVRADLLYQRGLALRSLVRLDDALADWREALAIYEEMGEAEAAGRVCYEMAKHLAWAARMEEALEIASRGLAAIGDRVNAERCLLLSVSGLAVGWGPDGDYARANAMIEEAVEMARELPDGSVMGQVLRSKVILHHGYLQWQEEVDAGVRGAELLSSAGNLYDMADVLSFVAVALFYLGRFDEAAVVLDEAVLVATRLGHSGARWNADSASGPLHALREGDLDRYEERARAVLDFGLAAGLPWMFSSYMEVGFGHFWRGRWSKAREYFEEAAALAVPGPIEGTPWGPLFLLTAYAGDRGAALEMLAQHRDDVPSSGHANTWGAWESLLNAVEGLAVLGERDEAARLYPMTLEAIDIGAVVRSSGFGLLQTTAGIAAACGGQWEKAEEHYETALRQAQELPHKIEQPEVRRWYARMLIDRNGPGDRQKARELLTEAVEMYRKIGMPKHVEMAEAMLGET
jgi:class 3 adenylate cyclase/tetratricopeptide (TPR) repeat protein